MCNLLLEFSKSLSAKFETNFISFFKQIAKHYTMLRYTNLIGYENPETNSYWVKEINKFIREIHKNKLSNNTPDRRYKEMEKIVEDKNLLDQTMIINLLNEKIKDENNSPNTLYPFPDKPDKKTIAADDFIKNGNVICQIISTYNNDNTTITLLKNLLKNDNCNFSESKDNFYKRLVFEQDIKEKAILLNEFNRICLYEIKADRPK